MTTTATTATGPSSRTTAGTSTETSTAPATITTTSGNTTGTTATQGATATQGTSGPDARCTGLRAARTRRTRAAIQTAALRLAAERGFDATTVEDVAAAAGVSRRTVFNYFPAKADMFIIGPRTPSQEEIETFVASRGDLLDDLAALLADTAPSTPEEVELFGHLKAVLHDSPELLPLLQSRIRLLESVVRAAIAQRLDAPLKDPHVVATTALAAAIVKGATSLWSSSLEDDDASAQPGDSPSTAPGSQPGAPGAGGPRRRPTSGHPPAQTVTASISIVTTALREVLGIPADTTSQSRPTTSHHTSVRKENA